MRSYEFFRKLLKKEKEITRELSGKGRDIESQLRFLRYFIGEADVEPEDIVEITFHLVRK
ncbi:MAG: hypothetical protein Q8R38_05060 [Candidatus Omnitrophota bacterium]|nr:hypothetical protein [Candidatus Omnitrophota bacterium]